jgi:hypothetical protein
VVSWFDRSPILAQVVFTGGKGGQDEVVKLVAAGFVDVGFVRTGACPRPSHHPHSQNHR